MKTSTGYRSEHGTPVSIKGPKSNRSPSRPGTDGMDRCFADEQRPQSYSDSELDRASGYRGAGRYGGKLNRG